MSRKRRRAERRGRSAELLAALWLMAKGYRILAHRARTPFGEVDVVALKGATLALVEVKARSSKDAATHGVGLRQQERIARAGLDLARKFRLKHVGIRMDLMVVRPLRLPLHLRDAWRAEHLG